MTPRKVTTEPHPADLTVVNYSCPGGDGDTTRFLTDGCFFTDAGLNLHDNLTGSPLSSDRCHDCEVPLPMPRSSCCCRPTALRSTCLAAITLSGRECELTLLCSTGDEHPTDDGYSVLGHLFFDAADYERLRR
jgi:hypothetical protein